MKENVEVIIQNTEWLYFKLFENKLFFIDFWSIVHFLTGALLILLIEKMFSKRKWSLLLLLLLSYEVVEISIRYIALNIFLPETIKDQFTDVIVGFLGAAIFYNLMQVLNKNKTTLVNIKLIEFQIFFFGSFTIAFFWVGFYGYKYSLEMFNSAGINYAALLIWWGSLFVFGIIYILLKQNINRYLVTMVISWSIYFTGLCIIEYFFYHILKIHEVGAIEHSPLIFDIIHGTKSLHIFYLTVPFIFMLLFEGVMLLVKGIIAGKEIENTKKIRGIITQKLQPE